mgnify:CR=1 FL=1
MQEQTVTVTVTRTVLSDLEAAFDLLEWAHAQTGLYCVVSAKSDGTVSVEVGGVQAEARHATLGDEITWDGAAFTVVSPEPEPEPVAEPVQPSDVSSAWA